MAEKILVPIIQISPEAKKGGKGVAKLIKAAVLVPDVVSNHLLIRLAGHQFVQAIKVVAEKRRKGGFE